jgi:tRNA A37 methylthiotransferase MiaB
LAERRYDDDVPEEVKSRRLTEIINKQLEHSLESHKTELERSAKFLLKVLQNVLRIFVVVVMAETVWLFFQKAIFRKVSMST